MLSDSIRPRINHQSIIYIIIIVAIVGVVIDLSKVA